MSSADTTDVFVGVSANRDGQWFAESWWGESAVGAVGGNGATARGESIQSLARWLGRAPSTILREADHNGRCRQAPGRYRAKYRFGATHIPHGNE
jgi:hypothetical protein